jgi:hypothetical protein
MFLMDHAQYLFSQIDQLYKSVLYLYILKLISFKKYEVHIRATPVTVGKSCVNSAFSPIKVGFLKKV